MAPSYTLDLSGYKPSISDTVPDGKYLAVVDDYEFGKSKAQNDMFTVYLRIQNGPYAGNVIIDRLTVTDKALFKIVGFLNGLGIQTPKKRLSINPEQWMRRKVWIDVSMGEPYRGRPGTSQIDGYSRYIADAAAEGDAVTEVQDVVEAAPVEDVAEVPFDEANSIENEMAEPDAAPASPAPPVKEFSTADAPAEPETLSLSDISL
jgi:hypothetical protein